MYGFTIVPRKLEPQAKIEVDSILNTAAEPIGDGVVKFPIKDLKELCKLSYLSQSAYRVLFYLGEFKFKNLKDLEEKAKEIDYSEFVKPNKTFAVRCKHVTEVPSSREIEHLIGSHIEGKVNLDKPDIPILAYICEDRCYMGIDFSGDLGRREYRIFTHSSAMAGPVAFCLNVLAGFKKGATLLDPFVGCGTIPIEAALHASKFSVNHFQKDKFKFSKIIDGVDEDFLETLDKESKLPGKQTIFGYDHLLRHVTAAKKNAKIAGILKTVYISKVSTEWLDAKFKKGQVDMIVTDPPQVSRQVNPKDAEKILDEFFYQCDYVLNKDGCVVLSLHSTDKVVEKAEKHNFKLELKQEYYQGKQKHFALKFKKS
jgi:putative N6-adenine-specific DNA methylase